MDSRAAAETAARLQSLYPSDADVLYQLAKVHRLAWNDAVFQMFQKTPSSFRVNQLSAEIFETQGRYADAISEYRKAIEKNPAAINLHYRLGRALLLESHQPEALRDARKQFEAFTAQGKELTSIAQSVATKTAEPIKESVTKAFNKAA